MINLHDLGPEKKEMPPWMFAPSGLADHRVFAKDRTYFIDYPIYQINTGTTITGGTFMVTGTYRINNT